MPWKRFADDTEVAVTGRKARFLVDESLGLGTTEVLRHLGWNVKDVSEVGLSGHPDENVFAYAYREDRILLTHDTDFLDDTRFPPHRNGGVVVLPGGSGDEVALLRGLRLCLALTGRFHDVLRGMKVIVGADRTVTIIARNERTGAMGKTWYRIPPNGDVLIWED